MDSANHPNNSTSRSARQSIRLDLRESAYALASSLVQSGLSVRSVTAYSADTNEIIVEVAPDSTVTISAIDTLTKSAARSRLGREIALAGYIKSRTLEDPNAAVSVREASKATGIPRSSLLRCEAWIAYGKLLRRDDTGKLRTRQLTDQMIACVRDHTASDPADIVEAREEIARLFEEQRRDAQSDRW